MSTTIRFVLLCEGSSDQPLVGHLQDLLVSHGATAATGRADWSKGRVSAKLTRLLESGEPFDLAFVHRDADGPNAESRIKEIDNGVREAVFSHPYIPVVPVQETEAWLLIDEAAIRSVVGNPHGNTPLNLPSPEHVEHVPRPKEALRQALINASGKSGRRLKEERKRFTSRRLVLLQRLDPEGIVKTVPSWRRLEQSIDNLARDLGWVVPTETGS